MADGGAEDGEGLAAAAATKERSGPSAFAALRSGAGGDADEDPALGKHHEGSFRVYMKHKRQKLGKQYASLRDEGAPQIFAGEVFWINGVTALEPSGMSQKGMRDLILRHGGRYLDVETPAVTIAICRNLNHEKARKEKEIKRVKRKHFLLPSWVVDSVAASRALPKQDYVIDELRPENQRPLFARGIAGANAVSSKGRSSVVRYLRYENLVQVAADANVTEAVAFDEFIQWVGADAPDQVFLGMSAADAQRYGCVVRKVDRGVLDRVGNKFKMAVRALAMPDSHVRCIGLSEIACLMSANLSAKDVESLLEKKLVPGSRVVVEDPPLRVDATVFNENEHGSLLEDRALMEKTKAGTAKSIRVTRKFGCDFQDAADLKRAIQALLTEAASADVTSDTTLAPCQRIVQLCYHTTSSSRAGVGGEKVTANLAKDSIEAVARALSRGIPYDVVTALTLKSSLFRTKAVRGGVEDLVEEGQRLNEKEERKKEAMEVDAPTFEATPPSPCGKGFDAAALAALPADLRAEVLQNPSRFASPQKRLRDKGGSPMDIISLVTPEKRRRRLPMSQPSSGSPHVDMAVWNCLPPDVQEELRRDAEVAASRAKISKEAKELSTASKAALVPTAVGTQRGQQSMLGFARVVGKRNKKRGSKEAKARAHADRQFAASIDLVDRGAKHIRDRRHDVVQNVGISIDDDESTASGAPGVNETWAEIRPVILEYLEDVRSTAARCGEEEVLTNGTVTSAASALAEFAAGLASHRQLAKTQNTLRLVRHEVMKRMPHLAKTLWQPVIEETQRACVSTYGAPLRLL
ncbi:DNA repair protein REV1 [Hondaea fermentalgiana]|uniref:DNA repair protein REV1 n=1 Tax=Hondaea fermentalgiana TaxID=2315210 RepID=A0A2R5GX84_9STRA|nr:DNA repair protein REV1 [Hondaea fermentalgiana]|eukprot:GBG34388.1 DNA repair protein REV1 [Hondaea fermentalgiana]